MTERERKSSSDFPAQFPDELFGTLLESHFKTTAVSASGSNLWRNHGSSMLKGKIPHSLSEFLRLLKPPRSVLFLLLSQDMGESC
jgi:hypothetical protein